MAIVGPTATGKSRLAMDLAEQTGAQILSVDSMQVYRGMDIGTAKPTLDQRLRVPHHMIDLAEPEQPYTVADFRRDAREALRAAEEAPVILVGGSGLHFRSVVDPMRFLSTDAALRAELEQADWRALARQLEQEDEQAGDHIDLTNRRRVIRAVEALRLDGVTPSRLAVLPEREAYRRYMPEFDFVGIGIDRHDIEGLVTARLETMRRRGLLEEVAELADRLGPTASQAVGYRQLRQVIEGRIDEEKGWEEARRATLRLVKRQRTFFRRDPRLDWYDAARPDLLDIVAKKVGL